jgi:hypothetical protein
MTGRGGGGYNGRKEVSGTNLDCLGRASKRRFSELSWRELPATMPRSSLTSPPPLHMPGIAMSSLPTMLINWLGCQSKHSIELCFKRLRNLNIEIINRKTYCIVYIDDFSSTDVLFYHRFYM